MASSFPGVAERLGGADMGAVRGRGVPGLRPLGSPFGNITLNQSLSWNPSLLVHGGFFTGGQADGGSSSLEGSYHALRGGAVWKGMR